MEHTNISYRPNDLRKLEPDTARKIVNARLKELYDAGKKLVDFKCETLNMSNSSAHQIMTLEFGFIKPRGELYYREKTDEEIATASSSESPMNSTKPNDRRYILDSIRNTEKVEKIRTSFMICVDTRKEWNEFCSTYYMIDKTLIHDAALRMYMAYFKADTNN